MLSLLILLTAGVFLILMLIPVLVTESCKIDILKLSVSASPFYEKEVSEAQFTELVFEVGCKNIFSHIGSNFV